MQLAKLMWEYAPLRGIVKLFVFGSSWREMYYESMRDTVNDLSILETCEVNTDIAKDVNSSDLFFHEATLNVVKEGRDISEVFSRFFPKQETQLLAGGTVSSQKNLPYILALDYTKETVPLRGTIKKTYITFFFYLALVSFFMLFLLPASRGIMLLFEHMIPNLFDNDENMLMFLKFTEVFQQVKYFILVGLILIVAFMIWYMPRKPTSVRRWLDNHVFPFGFYRKSGSSIFLKTYSALLNSGLKEAQALEKSAEYANPYFKHYINIMMKRAREGQNPIDVYNVALFSKSTRAFLVKFVAAKSSQEGINSIARMEIKQLINKSTAVMRTTTLVGLVTVALLITLVMMLNLWLVADVQEYSSRISSGF
jgi:type II secretory pathway component PulF